jgi:hypothetical protein
MSLLGTPEQQAAADEAQIAKMVTGSMPFRLADDPDYRRCVEEAAARAKDVDLNWFGK